MNTLTGHSYSEEESDRFLHRRSFWRQPAEAHDPYNVIARLAREYTWTPKVDCLEVCCGDGLASVYVRDAFEDTRHGAFYGIDGSEPLLERAPEWLNTTQGDVHAAIWPQGLDIILMPFCLYHVDPSFVFERAAEALNRDGIIVASWMNPASFHELFADWLQLPHAWNGRLYWDFPSTLPAQLGLTSLVREDDSYSVDVPSRAAAEKYATSSMWWRSGIAVPSEEPPATTTAHFGYGVWRKS